MTDEYFMEVQKKHDRLMLTEEIILLMKSLEDNNEYRNRLETLREYSCKGWAALLCNCASRYLNIIRNIGYETSARAQLEMSRDMQQDEFNMLEPREENEKIKELEN
jgi:hypothetical protein